jgi:hypothetical protein
MRIVCVAVALLVVSLPCWSGGAEPAKSPPGGGATKGQPSGIPPDAIKEMNARLDFAPMWWAVPRFAGIPAPVPAGCYATVWDPRWQQELALTAEQKKSLQAINDKAMAETRRHADEFQKLTPEERAKEVESWAGKSSPRQRQFEDDLRRQIEAVLTPQQLQVIKDDLFPIYAVQALYDAKTREQIGLSPKQAEAFRSVVRERLERGQEESLKNADQIWALMTPQQQTQLVDVVKHQGSTSAVLSLAWELGFDMDAAGLSYPMLSEPAVRKRLGLGAEQQRELEAVVADSMAKARKARQEGNPPDASGGDKQRIEAILTPKQLKVLDEIGLRRRVVLAMGYPEKQESIGITDEQRAGIERIGNETHDRLYRIDREMLAKAVEILTPPQRDQLRAKSDE